MSDDITFCMDGGSCKHTKCQRHPNNIKTWFRDHSFAHYKGTERWCKDEKETVQ